MTAPGLDPPPGVGEDLAVGNVGGSSLPPSAPAVDLAPFRAYLLQLLPPVLGASSSALERFLVPGGRWETTAVKFLSDSNVNAVYVSQLRSVSVGGGDSDEVEAVEPRERYELSSSVASYSAEHRATLALIKRSPTLDVLQPLAGQLHLLNLFGPSAAAGTTPSAASSGSTTAPPGAASSDGQEGQVQLQQQQQQQQQETPYESLHQIVHWGVGPWFEAFVESRQQSAAGAESKDSKGEDGKMGARTSPTLLPFHACADALRHSQASP
jgi:dynein heavy chain 1